MNLYKLSSNPLMEKRTKTTLRSKREYTSDPANTTDLEIGTDVLVRTNLSNFNT